MSPDRDDLKIKKILVALDASPSSMAALEAAVELAAHHGAEVMGIFVEDVNLVRMAQLPFAREVLRFGARVRKLGLGELERQLQAQGERARRALAQLASQHGINWSFRVTRGDVPLEVLAEGEEVDFIILGRTGWSGQRRLGSTTRVVISKAPGHVLVMRKGVRISRPVMVAYDGSELAQQALAAGAALADRENLELTVLLLADSEKEAGELQDQAVSWLRSHDLAARFRTLISAEARELSRVVESASCLLVIPRKVAPIASEVLPDLIDELRCPVLVVR